MQNLLDRILALETNGKEGFVATFNKRPVYSGGKWAAERISEIPMEWQMEEAYVCLTSARVRDNGLWAVLSKGQSWSGGYTSGSRNGDDYDVGVRRTSTQFEIFKGDYNTGMYGFIVLVR